MVNLAKSVVVVPLMTCIAAIMLGGCSDSDEPDSEPSSTTSIPRPTSPTAVDRLGIWSTGQPASPEIRDYGASVGLFGVSVPQAEFRGDYEAVAPFGGECFVAILKLTPGETGELRDLYVGSRFNDSVKKQFNDGPPEAVSRLLDELAPICGASR